MGKITISLSDGLLQNMDQYAKDNFMTRSGFISMCCSQFLQSIEMQRIIVSISSSMQKLADAAESGSIDGATMKEFERFQSLSQLLTQSQFSKRI